ncbi:MAG: YjbH domain-containing protein [Chlorobi bacterium]|nr:YjbH domain-containing protein [Chlorobiota bacterium]
MMYRLGAAIVLLSLLVSGTRGQGSAGELALYESQRIVDMPTAGVLPTGGIQFRAIVFDSGGMTTEALIAPLARVQIGLGYSGSGIVGSGNVRWQGPPALLLRWRFLDETPVLPALAIGVETLGRGEVANGAFATAAPGAYFTLSKQFRWWLGGCAIHAGIGYGLDLRFNGGDINMWIGAEQSIGRSMALSIEANPQSIERSRPLLLNLAARWSVLRGVTLEFYLRDLLARSASQPRRWVGIECIARLSEILW